MQRNAADTIFSSQQNMGTSAIFDDDDDEIKDLTLEAKASDHVELVDIFQDEGHRVGAYALWDSCASVYEASSLLSLV